MSITAARQASLLAQVAELNKAIDADDPDAAASIFRGTSLIDGKPVPRAFVLNPYEPIAGQCCELGASFGTGPPQHIDVAPIFPMLTAGRTGMNRVMLGFPEMRLEREVERLGGAIPIIGTAPDGKPVNLFDYVFRAVEHSGPMSGARYARNAFGLVDPASWQREEMARPLMIALMDSVQRELTRSTEVDVCLDNNFLTVFQDALQSEVLNELRLADQGFGSPLGIYMRPLQTGNGEISLLHVLCQQLTAFQDRAGRLALIMRHLLTAAEHSGMTIGGPQGLVNVPEGRDGQALLHCACSSRNIALAKELLAWGADPLQKNVSGATPGDLLPADELASEIRALLAAAEARALAQRAVQAMSGPSGDAPHTPAKGPRG